MKINLTHLKADVLEILASIAPELEPAALNHAQPLREQVDLDSMDWLNFLIRLHERFKVTIAEADYARLISLDDIAYYLAARL